MAHKLKSMSATEVKNRFGSVLREVTRGDEPLVVERSGRPVAVILSLKAYEATCRQSTDLLKDRAQKAREAFGLWAQREDLGDDWLAEGRKRWRSEWAHGGS